MANLLTTRYIDVTGTIDTNTDQLIYTGAVQYTASLTVTDLDNSNTISTGDYFSGGFPYTGHTININGWVFAVFTSPTPGHLLIPHNGQVALVDLPASPATLVEQTDVAVANCFLDDTRIATPEGARRIRDLRAGDKVTTADGHAVEVRWLGRRTVQNILGLNEASAVVEIKADTFAPGVPEADLRLTADHGLILDGQLINAGALVNGRQIRFLPMAELPAEFTVWHVETEAHDTILANGVPAESFVDYAGRKAFDNYDEYLALCGVDRIVPEMPLPRISSRRHVPEALKRCLGLEDRGLVEEDGRLSA